MSYIVTVQLGRIHHMLRYFLTLAFFNRMGTRSPVG